MLNSSDKDLIEVGIDEAGRGCLCGRVYVAAVILPNSYKEDDELYLQINDSKKLSKKKREILKEYIEKIALDYSVDWAEKEEIDECNILQATINSMHRCVKKLKREPENILVDGNYFRIYKDENNIIIPHQLVKGGDTKFRNIAAASILAKVYRDTYIEQLVNDDEDLKKYGWLNNKGYGTKEHMQAIKTYGITKYHRLSYGPCKNLQK